MHLDAGEPVEIKIAVRELAIEVLGEQVVSCSTRLNEV